MPMRYEVPRSLVDAFCKAYAARDVEKIAEFLHDDVEWTISGPVDLLPFCGTHRGKANVLDMIGRRVPLVLCTTSFVPQAILVDGDKVAMLSRQSARRTEDGRAIGYRVANVLRFWDGLVIENLSLIDTFDAVEQLLGQQIEVPGTPRGDASQLVAV
jgi:ketosteroid isomerase-like protein